MLRQRALLSVLPDAACVLRCPLCYEIVRYSQPFGSSGNGSFQCFLPFSWVVSTHASTVSTRQKPMGPYPLALCPPPCTLWLLSLPELSTLFAHLRRPLCLGSLLLPCGWGTLGFERCVAVSASCDCISWHMTDTLLGIHSICTKTS